MDKFTLSRICAFAGQALLESLAVKAAGGREAALLKGPEKTMVLLRIREPIRRGRFYLGELLAARCMVELGGVRGAAVLMGDNLDKVRSAAILDAAHSGGFPGFALVEPELLRLEEARKAELAKEAAEIRKTRVSFQALEDREL
ncbi:MAG: phosphonate C-P lyase system protein PhnG [Spirochaetaceae bacterium]|jgi:alpha-D-ribose 1-methylphosphonate 5-triphosphate synthase subunit PhnG|nr:phosphonate C-P lyase system protein PhnG [Spirochaetaceae bacterium]